MNGAKRGLTTAGLLAAGWLAAGCQAPPTPVAAPVAVNPPAPTPTPAAATAPANPSTPHDPRAETAARLAAQQAKSIQDLIDARNAESAGVPVIEPAKRTPPAPPVPVTPPAVTPPAAAAPAPSPAPGPDNFRPVPPIGSANLNSDMPMATATPPGRAAPPPAADPFPVPPPAVAPPAGGLGVAPVDPGVAQAAKDHPRDLAPQLDDQLQRLARGENVPSPESLAALTAEDRDLLTGILDGLSDFRRGVIKDPNGLINRKIKPLVAMADRLRAKADLSIANLNLCRTVQAYGNYTAITPMTLTQGVNYKPIIYYEVENVAYRLDAANMWAATMRQDVVLYDAAGQIKWVLPPVAVTDLCRNRRRDFFYAKVIALPVNLLPGEYTLKLTLADLVANRVSEASLTIKVVPPAVAPPPPLNPMGPALPR